jgi:hypothetical protein
MSNKKRPSIHVAQYQKELALFDPTTEKEKQQHKRALKEMKEIAASLKQSIEVWRTKHENLGAWDSAVWDEVVFFVMHHGLGIETLYCNQ